MYPQNFPFVLHKVNRVHPSTLRTSPHSKAFGGCDLRKHWTCTHPNTLALLANLSNFCHTRLIPLYTDN